MSLIKRDSFQTYLVCPVCDCENIHIKEARKVGQSAELSLWCESGHHLIVSLKFHKGTTFVECIDDINSESTVFEGIDPSEKQAHVRSYHVAERAREYPPLIGAAEQLAARVLTLLKRIPKKELGSVKNQLERACVSIPSNLSEGDGRKHGGKGIVDRLRFFRTALGSAKEAFSQLRILRLTIPKDYESEIESSLELLGSVIEMISKEVNQEESDV